MDRKIEQSQEGRPGAEEVLVHVRREIQIGQQAVRGGERSGVHVDRPGQLAAYFVEMAVDLFQHPLQAAEGGGERRRIRDKVGLAKAGEGPGVAVLRPPAPGDLVDPVAGALGVLRSVALNEAIGGPSLDLRGDGGRGHG